MTYFKIEKGPQPKFVVDAVEWLNRHYVQFDVVTSDPSEPIESINIAIIAGAERNHKSDDRVQNGSVAVSIGNEMGSLRTLNK